MLKRVLTIYIILASITIFTIVIFKYVWPLTIIHVELKGDKEVTIEALSKYKDEGVVVKRGNKKLSKSKYNVNMTNNIKTDMIGDYQINYKVKVKKKIFKLKRKVKVVDTTKPEITLNFDTIKRDYCTKKISTDFDYTANDNYDNDITEKVVVLENLDKFVFRVVDSSGNFIEKEVEITDTDKPKNKFYLNGSSKQNVILNNEYSEKGASYIDGCGNKIDKEIKISGNVDTETPGDYTITYEVEGEKPITRIVHVYEKVYSPKTIYLTFDDGPGGYTQSILDTLDKYGVKATFFVTNQFPGYSYLIGEEYKRGHAIAVHTYTHSYGTVYASVDAYINDFNQMNEIIKQQTGSYSNLFRFPGGSSNTVHCSVNKGVVADIAAEMTNRGYVYFDWNVSSGDAAGYNSNKIYNAVVNGVEGCNSCVVLMHDIKSTTANALDGILATLTSKGYNFAVLDTSSPTAHHSIGRCK